jgi:hypothetical protein
LVARGVKKVSLSKLSAIEVFESFWSDVRRSFLHARPSTERKTRARLDKMALAFAAMRRFDGAAESEDPF